MTTQQTVTTMKYAYLIKKLKPTPMNVFTANYLRSKYVFAFCKR